MRLRNEVAYGISLIHLHTNQVRRVVARLNAWVDVSRRFVGVAPCPLEQRRRERRAAVFWGKLLQICSAAITIPTGGTHSRMVSGNSRFDASGPALGYIYQCLVALLLTLRKSDDPGLAVSIEKIDDITFEQSGSAFERLQTKHSATPGIVSDSSEAIWKTLRIWSEDIASGKLDPGKTVLLLLTSSSAPAGSGLAYLREDAERNPRRALAAFEQAARQSRNKAANKAVAAFTALTPAQRRSLVAAIYVLDRSPTAVQLRPLIIHELRLSAEPQHRDALADRLEGWWFEQVIAHLTSPKTSRISVQRVLAKAVEIGRQFHRDCLPDDFLNADVPPQECPETDGRRFVQQLNLIGIARARIRAAQEDYYRAESQRSRWVRDRLIDLPELSLFESRLQEAWRNMYLVAVEAVGEDAADDVLRQSGRELYNWSQTQAPANSALWVRPQFQAAYMTTGSFHVLADKDPPRVGWHPNFTERLAPADGTGA